MLAQLPGALFGSQVGCLANLVACHGVAHVPADQVRLRQCVREEGPDRIFVQAGDVVAVEKGVLDQFPVAIHRAHMLLTELVSGHAESVQVDVQSF